MYELQMKDLGIPINDTVAKLVDWNTLPDKFLGVVLLVGDTYQYMAFGINNLDTIIQVKKFPQTTFKKNIIGKPLVFRRYDSIDKYEYTFLSADVSKVWTPSIGRVICYEHPRHGLGTKFAPIGKVYNERFCLLPIKKDYKCLQ